MRRKRILLRFRQLAAGDIREKGPGDLVTVADEAAEVAITPAFSLCCLDPSWSARKPPPPIRALRHLRRSGGLGNRSDRRYRQTMRPASRSSPSWWR